MFVPPPVEMRRLSPKFAISTQSGTGLSQGDDSMCCASGWGICGPTHEIG